MRAGGLGYVTASKNPKFAIGDCVYGAFGVQEFGISNGNGITKINAGAIPVVAHPDIAKAKVSVVVGLNCFDKRPVISRGARPTIFVEGQVGDS